MPKEVYYLEQCRHIDGVLPMLDWYFYDAGYCIVMPLLDDVCDLFEFVAENRPDENSSRTILKQLVQILIECRKVKVHHGDIKLENILVNVNTLKIYLIDFGLSRTYRDTLCLSYWGTTSCTPPEYAIYHEYFMYDAEVWTLGILLYDIVCMQFAFANHIELVNKDVTFPDIEISSEVKQLICRCLSKDPTTRPCLYSLLHDEWFAL